MASIIEMWERGGQAAREGKQRAALSQYLQPATQGDSGALAQLYQAGLGEQAMGAQKFATEQRNLQSEDAGKAASMFAQTGDPQYYAMWRQSLAGLPNAPQLPEALEADDIEPAKQSAMAFAQAYGNAAGTPAGLQEFNALTRGLPADDVDRARRVRLGLDGRASSAGFGFEKVVGRDGRERMGRTNPRTGVFEVYDEGSGNFAPMGGPASLNGGPMPPQSGTFTAGAGQTGAQVSIDGMPAEQQQQMATAISAMRQAGVPDNLIDAFAQTALSQPRVVTPYEAPTGGNPALGVSQTPAEKSYATETGQQRAQIDALPDRGRVEADNAALKASAEQTAKNQVEVAAKRQQRARDDNETLQLLNQAEQILPGATGSGAGAATDYVAGTLGFATLGALATARLNIVAAKLVGKVPRFEGPQSNIDVQLYREAAGDLANPRKTVGERLAALRTMRSLIESYQNTAPTAGGSPKVIRYDAKGNRIQ